MELPGNDGGLIVTPGCVRAKRAQRKKSGGGSGRKRGSEAGERSNQEYARLRQKGVAEGAVGGIPPEPPDAARRACSCTCSAAHARDV
jgi:hypothetical protein